jgi:hypothetical protein
MSIAFYIFNVINVILDALLLSALLRQGIRKQLPWFVSYVAYALLFSCISLAIPNLSLYSKAYWWSEVLNVLVVIGTLRESLLRSFRNSTLPTRFHRLLWTALVAALGYSALKAVYAPPVQSNPLMAFMIGAEFTVNWAVGIVAGAVMFYLRKNEKKEKMGEPEPSIIYGLGVAACAVLLWAISRSIFGIKVASITQYAPPVGYWFAVVWWLRVFSSPQFGLKELGINVHDALKMVGTYSGWIERIEKRK